jgi:hypothetical protein
VTKAPFPIAAIGLAKHRHQGYFRQKRLIGEGILIMKHLSCSSMLTAETDAG